MPDILDQSVHAMTKLNAPRRTGKPRAAPGAAEGSGLPRGLGIRRDAPPQTPQKPGDRPSRRPGRPFYPLDGWPSPSKPYT